MDTNRFDSLVKSLATGTNRRSVLKGLVGLGGAAAVTSVFLEPEANAARRPTPTPKPITCPAGKHWDGTQCVCTTGGACGSECCHVGTECCDGACCFGHCYGEELCCPYDNWCAAASECCAAGETCCGELGCILSEEGDCGCDGVCPDGFECCGSECCASGFCAGTTCCALSPCGDACLTSEDQGCCAGTAYTLEGNVCCSDTIYAGVCCGDEACGTCSKCVDHRCTQATC